LSRRIDEGSSIKWTPKQSLTKTTCDSLKENDGGANHANPPLHERAARSSTQPSFSAFDICTPPDRIFIDSNTIRTMEKEVEKLTLPATLACVALMLRTSEEVLDAHADAVHSRQNDDDNKMKQLEILGPIMDKMSLSPTQKLNEGRESFRCSCQSLVSGGNKVELRSWEEAKSELSVVFNFARVDIKVSPRPQWQTIVSSTPALNRKSRTPSSKNTPKRAHRLSPKKKRADAMSPKKANKALSLKMYRDQIKAKMGEMMFRQVFQQGEILPKKPSIIADAAERLDEKIKQKESERRSEASIEEILAAKEKADKEKEAKESAAKLMRLLTPEEQSIVDEAIRGSGPDSEILSSQGADSVQRGSMRTLGRNSWLNDEVINYFLKNCLAKRDEMLCTKQPGRKRSHFFNSFFVQTMFDEKNSDSNLAGKYNYKNVKRWGKKVPGKDIFNLKYIVCPINLDNVHWTSAVIFMEEKRIQYYDSMGGAGMPKLQGLLQYLKDEHRAKKGTELAAAEWKLVPCTKDTPRQLNGVDCGVFTCMFCDFTSKDCPLVFTQEHIAQCRERIALSIMKNCAIE